MGASSPVEVEGPGAEQDTEVEAGFGTAAGEARGGAKKASGGWSKRDTLVFLDPDEVGPPIITLEMTLAAAVAASKAADGDEETAVEFDPPVGASSGA